jgi:addiction module RelB/DinJ family antitoxin
MVYISIKGKEYNYNMNSTTLNIKIDKDTKREAQKIASQMGLPLNSVVSAFLKQLIRTKRFEINLITENGFTNEFEEDAIKETNNAEKKGKTFNSVDELMSSLIKH